MARRKPAASGRAAPPARSRRHTRAWASRGNSGATRDVDPPDRPITTPFRVRPAASDCWLVLADGPGAADLVRAVAPVSVHVEPDRRRFAASLTSGDVAFVVLESPPALLAEVEQVGRWLSPGRSAVLVSRHDASFIRLRALELGFADALDAAADVREIQARIEIASRRRLAQPLYERHRLRVPVADGAEIDLGARVLLRRGRPVALRPREYALLEFLATHPGRTFTRRELVGEVCASAASNERVVDVYVCWLRAKIEDDPRRPARLVTVPGAGYRFDLGAMSPDLTAPQ